MKLKKNLYWVWLVLAFVRTVEMLRDLPLGSKNHETHEWTRLSHLEESEQVHALVVGFLQQGFDPAVVALHAAHTV